MTATLLEIRCPECGSNRVRRGKENDNVLKCTCQKCGLRFEYDVLLEKIIQEGEQK